ncbi:Thioredoxin 2 [Spiroplasma sp. JKS002669]|uniref:thioredoxin n=1 Tax=Spiroplasma attinicola TaxID=2904537 RepID=UPI002023016C|nr:MULTISPECIES: thioredoxin [unclassified Spiroplasma]MCL6429200.1 Thioredoxin 2 [Spiroplasma sp. JKS002669]MCL8209479.1 Thioredoxin 2 [Spiroplasma sp. JKS002670]MCL8210298.1 Thioredoxin 2 [Spiroplasma sp. JKS002671]
MSKIITVNKVEELNKILKANKYAIVDFYADWCPPCKALAPIFEDLSKEVDDVTFIKINVDHSEELKDKFKISSIPTLIYFKDDQEATKTFGFVPKPTLLSHLNNLKK